MGLAIATTRGRAAGRAGRRAAAAKGCRATAALLLSAMLLATEAAMFVRAALGLAAVLDEQLGMPRSGEHEHGQNAWRLR